MPLRRAVAGAVLLGLTAACTSDPRDLDSGELHDLIERGLEEADQDNALHFTADEADCTAGGVMADISDQRLKDLGIDEGFGLSTLEFTPDEQATVFAVLEDCVDLVGQVAGTLADDAGLSADEARCVAEGYVGSDPFREALFAERFDPALNERIDAALADAAATCRLTPPA